MQHMHTWYKEKSISGVPSSTCKMLADHLQLYTSHFFLYPVVIENMWYKYRDGGQVANM